MKYTQLGHSGLQVSEICLGTMTFGEEFGIGAAAPVCREIFDGFLDAGGNFIDTANIYNRGSSETMLGEFIGEHRDRLVLATKYTLSTAADDPNAGGSHRKNLVQALDASLRRLRTDYIDLYWVHGWDVTVSVNVVMRALDDQVRAGKILHIGISNAPAWVIATANVLATERGWTPFTATQLHYNLVERSIERDHFDLAAAQAMAVTAWSPLASGLLTGKYNTGAAEGARLDGSPRGAQVLTPGNLAVARQLGELASKQGCTASQLALAWMLRRSDAAIPIIGARNVKQLHDNLGAVDVALPAEVIEQLDELAPPAMTYPQSLLKSEFFHTMMYGHQHTMTGSAGQ